MQSQVTSIALVDDSTRSETSHLTYDVPKRERTAAGGK